MNLGRILFAIDHINQRCLDALQKMKNDGDDKGFVKPVQQEPERKVGNDKKEKAKVEVRDKEKEDEENFKKKCMITYEYSLYFKFQNR